MNKIAFPLVLALFLPFFVNSQRLSPEQNRQIPAGRTRIASAFPDSVPLVFAVNVPQSAAARRLIVLLPNDGTSDLKSAPLAVSGKPAGGQSKPESGKAPIGKRRTPTQAENEEARLATESARRQFANAIFAATLADLLPERR